MRRYCCIIGVCLELSLLINLYCYWDDVVWLPEMNRHAELRCLDSQVLYSWRSPPIVCEADFSKDILVLRKLQSKCPAIKVHIIVDDGEL